MPPPKERKFVYQSRSASQVQKRSEQKAGMYDSAYMPDCKTFVPNPGDHRLRILPATWDNAEHFGIDAWFHSSIGPDQQTYLCAAKMKKGECPVCDEAKTIKGKDKESEELLKQLKPYRRVLVWVIDRNDEAAGPLLYGMPWTMDRDINAMSIDRDTGEILEIDHPDKGYDIEFSKEGSGLKTQYTGTMISRRSSPISNDRRTYDDWMAHVQDKPLPEVLVFYSYEHIKSQFDGSVRAEDNDDTTQLVRHQDEIPDRTAKTDDEIVEVTDELEVEEVVADEAPKPQSTRTMTNRDRVRESLANRGVRR